MIKYLCRAKMRFNRCDYVQPPEFTAVLASDNGGLQGSEMVGVLESLLSLLRLKQTTENKASMMTNIYKHRWMPVCACQNLRHRVELGVPDRPLCLLDMCTWQENRLHVRFYNRRS